MNVSYGAAQSHINPFQQYQDVGKMSLDLQKEYLDKFDFLPAIKQEILESPKPLDTFIENLFWLRNNEANKANSEFNNFIYKNEIFIEEPLAKQFKSVSKKIGSALISRGSNHEYGTGRKEDDSWGTINKECPPLVESLGVELREKFFTRSSALAG